MKKRTIVLPSRTKNAAIADRADNHSAEPAPRQREAPERPKLGLKYG
jgi:hypothetical protein